MVIAKELKPYSLQYAKKIKGIWFFKPESYKEALLTFATFGREHENLDTLSFEQRVSADTEILYFGVENLEEKNIIHYSPRPTAKIKLDRLELQKHLGLPYSAEYVFTQTGTLFFSATSDTQAKKIFKRLVDGDDSIPLVDSKEEIRSEVFKTIELKDRGEILALGTYYDKPKKRQIN
jgi:hypothetical protein